MNSLRNQYCIIDKQLFDSTTFYDLDQKELFFDYLIFYDKNLKVSKFISDKFSIVSFGFIIDPRNPSYSERDILHKLINEPDLESILKEINYFSGRFVLFIRNNQNDYYILNDACGLRQIYYYFNNNKISFSSFPELLLKINKINADIDEETLKVINSKKFLDSEFAWYGDEWYDKRIKKILPNHYFSLSNKEIKRFPFVLISDNIDKIIENSIEILKNTYKSIFKRFSTIRQPLTAGWDSRLLLSVSKDFKEKINYYIFSDNFKTIPQEDIVIPKKIAEKLGLNFFIYDLEDLDENFLNNYTFNKLFPRILPKTRNYFWHFKNSSSSSIININGNCAEITRNFYKHIFFNKNYFQSALYYTHFENFFISKILNWKDDLEKAEGWKNLNLLDIFYWEHRMGNWHALYTFEQDITIEEISPFNNRYLLLLLLSLSKKYREKDNPHHYKMIIEKCWPECLSEPVNPLLNIGLKSIIINSFKKNLIIYKLIKSLNYYKNKIFNTI